MSSARKAVLSYLINFCFRVKLNKKFNQNKIKKKRTNSIELEFPFV
jgi:hypothetical protein